MQPSGASGEIPNTSGPGFLSYIQKKIAIESLTRKPRAICTKMLKGIEVASIGGVNAQKHGQCGVIGLHLD